MTQSHAVKRPLIDRLRAIAENLPSSPGMLFFRQFLADPKAIGSIIPTAQATIDAMLAPLDWDGCRTFVEYGPGTGVFTRSILDYAGPDTRVIAIDPNASFVEHLHRSLPDPRFHAVRGSAEDVEAILRAHGLKEANYILSGLPFSTLPQGVGDAIIAATERALTPGGAFLVYQYSLHVKPALEEAFGQVDVERAWKCIPPARLMRAYKD